MILFNFGPSNNLGWCAVRDDDDVDQQVGVWVSGRLLGLYISVKIPWRKRRLQRR